MTGRPRSLGMITLVVMLALSVAVCGCGKKDSDANATAPNPGNQKGTASAVTAPPKAGDSKVMTDTQKAVQAENSDGGGAPK